MLAPTSSIPRGFFINSNPESPENFPGAEFSGDFFGFREDFCGAFSSDVDFACRITYNIEQETIHNSFTPQYLPRRLFCCQLQLETLSSSLAALPSRYRLNMSIKQPFTFKNKYPEQNKSKPIYGENRPWLTRLKKWLAINLRLSAELLFREQKRWFTV